MALHAARFITGRKGGARKTSDDSPRSTTMQDAVKRISGNSIVGIDAAGTGNKGCRIEIVFLVVALAVSSEHTDAETKVERQSRGYVPVILEVGFKDFVPIVELQLGAFLGERGHVAHEQISDGIACGYGSVIAIKREHAVGSSARGAKLVLLCRDKVGSELQVMPSHDLDDIVAVGI